MQPCAGLVLFSLFSRQDSDVRDTVKRREEEHRFFEVWQNRFLLFGVHCTYWKFRLNKFLIRFFKFL